MVKKLEDLLEEEKTKLEDSLVDTSSVQETVADDKTEATPVAEETVEAAVTAEDFDATSDIQAIFGDVDVSEEFKAKAKRVYEASVVALSNQIVEKVAAELYEHFAAESAALIETHEKELEEEVDGFLSFAADKWIGENKIEATNAIRADLAESFMTGLKQLLEDHYVDLPEDKVDLVATMEGTITDLETAQNELLEQVVSLRKEKDAIVEAHAKEKEAQLKESAVSTMAADLTDVERDKFTKLSESIEFTTPEEYNERLNEIHESYFKKEAGVASSFENEEVIELEEEAAPSIKASGFNVDGVLAHLGKTRRTAK